MQTKTCLVAGLFGFAALTSCTDENRKVKHEGAEVKGQVFIVQKNRETLKLSLVQVEIVDAAVANERLEKKKIQAVEKLKPLLDTKGSLTDSIDTLKKEISNLVKDGKASMEKMKFSAEMADSMAENRRLGGEKNLAEERRYTFEAESLASTIQKLGKQLEQLRAQLKATEKELSQVEKEIASAQSSEICFEEPWPKVIASATTDADGRFTIKLPKGKFVIAAHASRELLGAKEHYGWMVPIDVNSASDISLNNNNMIRPLDQ